MSAIATYDSMPVSNREAHDMLRDLDRAASDKTLTSQRLSTDIRFISPRDGSVGITWILSHQHEFIDCVPRDDRLEFFALHYDNPSITLVATSFELLRFISPLHRTDFIREVAERHLIPGWEWITDAKYLGVSTELLAEQVLNRLNGTLLDKETTAEFVEHFLANGAGRVIESTRVFEERPRFFSMDSNTLWSVFTDTEELIEVMKVCARHTAQLFFAAGDPSLQDKLTARLSHYQVGEILDVAADELSVFENIPDWALESLSAQGKLRLANRALPGSLSYIVRLILSSFYEREYVPVNFSEELNFLTLCERGAAPINRGDLLAMFQDLYDGLSHAMGVNGIARAQDLYDELVERLATQGYVIGTVESELFRSRRQHFVEYDHYRYDNPGGFSVKYVLFTNRGRTPEVGTSVIIDVRNQGNRPIHAGGKVVLTNFIPMNGGNGTA